MSDKDMEEARQGVASVRPVTMGLPQIVGWVVYYVFIEYDTVIQYMLCM
jgi:hypothetical protein